MIRSCTLLLIVLLITGCIRTVTRQELDQRISAHDAETVNWVDYAGTTDGFHYLYHSYTLGSAAYRIPVSQLRIESVFPLTKDRKKWRPLKKHWDIWGGPVIEVPADVKIIEANQ